MLKMLKKVFLSVFIVVLVSVAWFGYGALNLKENSVYYAQRTPHREGVEPVLIEVVRNLRWIYTPDIKGIKYDYDGYQNIYNYQYLKAEAPCFAYNHSDFYIYDEGDNLAYTFDNRFNLVKVWDRKTLNFSSEPVDESAVKRDIFRVVQPVIDRQSAPLFNLQWVYDWVNKDRFN